MTPFVVMFTPLLSDTVEQRLWAYSMLFHIYPYIFAWLSLKRSVSNRAELMWIHSAFNQNVISMRIKLGDLLRNIIKPKSKYDCIEKKLAKYDIYRHTCYCLSSVKQFEYYKQCKQCKLVKKYFYQLGWGD